MAFYIVLLHITWKLSMELHGLNLHWKENFDFSLQNLLSDVDHNFDLQENLKMTVYAISLYDFFSGHVSRLWSQ